MLMLMCQQHLSNAKLGKLVGANNPKYIGNIHTPFGIFESYNLAGKFLKCDSKTVYSRCRSTNEKYLDYYIMPKD